MTGTVTQRAPRFVFLSDSPSTRRQTPRDVASRYGWRLVAANNRPLGRGTGVSTSLADCQAAVLEVHAGAASLETTVSADGVRGVYTWRASLRGTPVATCTHPYVRRVECARALSQFLHALERARPDEGILRHFGARSLRGYETAGTIA